MLTLWRCQLTSPSRGMQGPQELNPHFARVGAGPPNRWLIPIKGEPPGGYSLGRFPVTQESALSGNLRDAQGKHRLRVAVPSARFIRLLERHVQRLTPESGNHNSII